MYEFITMIVAAPALFGIGYFWYLAATNLVRGAKRLSEKFSTENSR